MAWPLRLSFQPGRFDIRSTTLQDGYHDEGLSKGFRPAVMPLFLSPPVWQCERHARPGQPVGTMTKKYRSKALGALHETVQGLHRLGLIDTKTMREFDASCLTHVEKLAGPRAEKRTGSHRVSVAGKHG